MSTCLTPVNSTGSLRGAWFEQAKLGLFIHWGLYSILGQGEWTLFKDQIPVEEYNKLTAQFCPPASFSPEEWVLLAKRAGMNYAVLTTRHHDGFALFDSKCSAYNSVQTAAGRDFVREFVEACRKHDLRVGLYFSIMSWQFPACFCGPAADPAGWEAMVRQTHEQMRELMTNYGKIDLVWYDGCCTPGVGDPLVHQQTWRTPELNAMVRSLQPDILINDRAALPEDFSTPEQHVCPPARERRWEACLTINNSWGYNKKDSAYKSPEDLARCLTRCASFGGNFLLNVGPYADGSVQPEAVQRLEKLGDWLRVCGDAVYGAERSPFSEAEHIAGPASTRDGKAYFFLFSRPDRDLIIAGLPGGARSARVLGGAAAAVRSVAGGTLAVMAAGAIPAGAGADGLPVVLCLEAAHPADLQHTPPAALGAETADLQFESEAPVLAEVGLYDPDPAPVLTGKAFAALCRNQVPTQDAEAWCPGWAGRELLGAADGRISFALQVPATGRYNLSVGICLHRPGVVRALVDGVECERGEFSTGAYPDTLALNDLPLQAGARLLELVTDQPLAAYALRLDAAWRKLPSPLWEVIGPFPTEFGPQKPVSTVCDALGTVFPPEKEYRRDAAYSGAYGRSVSWTRTGQTVGNHSDAGVNFTFRGGREGGGVSYARTQIFCPEERTVNFALGCDWWANVYLNGELVPSGRAQGLVAQDGARFSTWKPGPAVLRLRAGVNVLLVKCHMGSTMHWFTGWINDHGDLRIGFDAR